MRPTLILGTLLLAALAPLVPPAAASPTACQDGYDPRATHHLCLLDDGECNFLLIVGTYQDDDEPWVWHLGVREAAVYDRPASCDNYGVASCPRSTCVFVAVLGMGHDGPLPDMHGGNEGRRPTSVGDKVGAAIKVHPPGLP